MGGQLYCLSGYPCHVYARYVVTISYLIHDSRVHWVGYVDHDGSAALSSSKRSVRRPTRIEAHLHEMHPSLYSRSRGVERQSAGAGKGWRLIRSEAQGSWDRGAPRGYVSDNIKLTIDPTTDFARPRQVVAVSLRNRMEQDWGK